MIGDLRHAWRSIRRMPLVSGIVVLSLAAGIGVNTVVFSWVQARLLNPIPGVADGASLRLIEPRAESGIYTGTSWPEYRDLRAAVRSFDAVFAARIVPLYVGEPGAVERVFGLLVSDNYFSALGVRAALGRIPDPHADASQGLAVISHGLWQARFGGSPDVLQRTVRVNGLELPIVGVTPWEFQGTTPGIQFDIWLPAAAAPLIASGSRELQERAFRGYGVMGRLAPGATPAHGQAEVDAVMRQLAAAHPATNDRITAEVLPFTMAPRGPQRLLNYAVLMLQAVMLLVLLAVCGNVANLMLARASARRHEMGVRLALGARPGRILSLVLLENLILGIAGAGLGVVLAAWGARALLVLPLTGLPLRIQTNIDLTTLVFAMALGVLCGLLCGGAPAMQLARVEALAAMRALARGGGRNRLRHTLMGVQVGLAAVVLIVGGLFLRAFWETRDTDPGFTRAGVLLVAYDLAGRSADATFNRVLATRILERVGALGSVESVAIAASVPLDIHGLPSRGIAVEGHARADGQLDEALMNIVSPAYFRVMQIPFVEGRDFADLTDTAAPRQAIVNEEFVSRYIPRGGAVGRVVRARGGSYVIAGVVRNSLYDAYGEPPTPVIHFSYRDTPQPRGEIHVRVRGGDERRVGDEIRRVLRELDAELPVFNARTLSEHVESNLIFRRIPARLFSVLGPMLLVLAGVGIYAVVAYAASRRRQEIGVRLAMGATPARVARQFVGETMSVAVTGMIVGWALAFLLAAQFADRLISVTVFVSVPGILLGVAAGASWIPARRAARLDPARTLKAD